MYDRMVHVSAGPSKLILLEFHHVGAGHNERGKKQEIIVQGEE